MAARLYVAVGRGLLLDVLATGEGEEVDVAMRLFSDLMRAYRPGPVTSGPSALAPLGKDQVK